MRDIILEVIQKRREIWDHICLKRYLYARILIVVWGIIPFRHVEGWGFFAHKKINEQAVFLLPVELLAFYKEHLAFIREEAVKPDKRRYAIEGEACRHYINIENYEALGDIPVAWHKASRCYEKDFMDQYGILPWHITLMSRLLTRAFEAGDGNRILRLSADLGHYIADANVPLHTTENYNGQLTDQHGIHGLWESRLPELFSDAYDFLFEEKAIYIEDIQAEIWQAIREAHRQASMVLSIEKELDDAFPRSEKYVFERRGGSIRRMYSRAYAHAYHEALEGMVERQMRASIKMVASVWMTCWINAGCPDLRHLTPIQEENIIEELPEEFIIQNVRPHEYEE